MGTRGFVTFVIDGTEKTAYNHWDSYPSGLGVEVLTWLRSTLDKDKEDGLSGMGLAIIRAQAKTLRVVDRNSEPTDEDIERLREFYDGGVGERRERPDWYQLLRGTQGDPAAMLRAGVIEDASDFPADSLMAEWGYVVDVDAQTFEVYRGFQTSPHSKGRFATRPLNPYSIGTQYHPVALAASWKFSELPDDKTLMAATEDD